MKCLVGKQWDNYAAQHWHSHAIHKEIKKEINASLCTVSTVPTITVEHIPPHLNTKNSAHNNKQKKYREDYNSVDSKEVNRIVTTIAFFA